MERRGGPVHISVVLAEFFRYDAGMDIRRLQQLSGVRYTRPSLRDARGVVTPPWDHEAPQAFVEGYKYTGMPSWGHPAWDKMLHKGYLDLGRVEPKLFKKMHVRGVAQRLNAILLSGKTQVFIRDPEGIFKKHEAELEKTMRRELEAEFDENAANAGEAENPSEEARWSKAAAKARQMRVKLAAVQGKSGAGYRVQVSPHPAQMA